MKPRRKKKTWFIWTSVVLAVVLIVVVAMAKSAKRALQAMMPDYQQVQATVGDLDLTVYGSGSLAASNAVNVPAPMPGSVAEWYYEAGDEVREGDILGVMDTDKYDAQVESLKDRIEELESAIESYQDQLDTSIAYSPINGVIKEVYVQAGSDVSLVNQVYGCYMRLAPDDTMTVTFAPEGAYARDLGDKVLIYAEGYDRVVGEVTAVSGMMSTVECSAYIPSGAKVTIRDISGKEEIGTGTLVCQDSVTINSQNKVKAVYVQAGQSVSRGQKLLEYDSDAAGSIEDKKDDLAKARADLAELEAASPEIVATAGGILTSVNEMELNMGLTAAQIAPLDAMDLVVAIDELDIAKVQLGQSASVSIGAIPGKTYTGTVSRISQIGESMGGVTTYNVTLTIDETEDLRIGMNASAEILVDSRQDVIILPLEAIQWQGDRPYVLLAGGNAPQEGAQAPGGQVQFFTGGDPGDLTEEERQALTNMQSFTASATGTQGTVQFVEVGMMNEQFAEIISGIEEGDMVLMPVSMTSTIGGMRGMGMMGGGGNTVIVTESRHVER